MSHTLALRNAVTAIVEAEARAHQEFVEALPNGYGNADMCRRSAVLRDIKQLRRELLVKLDAAIVNAHTIDVAQQRVGFFCKDCDAWHDETTEPHPHRLNG